MTLVSTMPHFSNSRLPYQLIETKSHSPELPNSTGHDPETTSNVKIEHYNYYSPSTSPNSTKSSTSRSSHSSEHRNDTAKHDTQADIPLDFSKYSKLKAEDEEVGEMGTDSGHLRNILRMGSPELSIPFVSKALNLSKEPGGHETTLNSAWNSNKSISDSPHSVRSSSTASPCNISAPNTPATIALSPEPLLPFPVPCTEAQILHSNPICVSSNTRNPIVFTPIAPYNSDLLSPIQSHTTFNIPFPQLSSEQFRNIFPGNVNPSMAFTNAMSIPANVGLATMSMNTSHLNGCASVSEKARITRPFKAYPKDPSSFPALGLYGVQLPMNFSPRAMESFVQQETNRKYAEFRNKMMSKADSKARRGIKRDMSVLSLGMSENLQPIDSDQYRFGVGANETMGSLSNVHDDNSSSSGYDVGKPVVNKSVSQYQTKDEAYWERRRKNNEAAKRSRDSRRAKEDEIAIRAVFLEQENMKLSLEVANLRNELTKAHRMMSQMSGNPTYHNSD